MLIDDSNGKFAAILFCSAMSSAEKALIDRNDNEQGVDLDATKDATPFKKDTKYSWFVCSCTFVSQVFVLGILHAYGVLFVEFVKEFKAPKGKAGNLKENMEKC